MKLILCGTVLVTVILGGAIARPDSSLEDWANQDNSLVSETVAAEVPKSVEGEVGEKLQKQGIFGVNVIAFNKTEELLSKPGFVNIDGNLNENTAAGAKVVIPTLAFPLGLIFPNHPPFNFTVAFNSNKNAAIAVNAGNGTTEAPNLGWDTTTKPSGWGWQPTDPPSGWGWNTPPPTTPGWGWNTPPTTTPGWGWNTPTPGWPQPTNAPSSGWVPGGWQPSTPPGSGWREGDEEVSRAESNPDRYPTMGQYPAQVSNPEKLPSPGFTGGGLQLVPIQLNSLGGRN